MNVTDMFLNGLNIEMILKIFLSIILGGFIGFERRKRNKTTGVVTHFIVSLSATLLTIVQLEVISMIIETNKEAGFTVISGDPARIVAQIVSGIGFIGAGVILKTQGHVSGITTAATLWITAIIGIVVGYGYFGLAIFSTGVSLFLMFLLKEHIKYRDAKKSH
jgi:putative Mg2+ transporter-C (MgtC) family protein